MKLIDTIINVKEGVKSRIYNFLKDFIDIRQERNRSKDFFETLLHDGTKLSVLDF